MNINCTQCGANINLKPSDTFVQCPFCDVSLYLDKSRMVIHYYVISTLDDRNAESYLRRWMAGNETAQGLEDHAEITDHEFYFFPFWRFLMKGKEDEKVVVRPAIATAITELKLMDLPGGIMSLYNPKKGKFPGDFLDVEIPYSAVLEQLKTEGLVADSFQSVSLVHVPIHRFTYKYQDWHYTALVESATGKIYANYFPERPDTPFNLVTAVSFLSFFLVGIITDNFWLRLVLYIITAIPVGYVAYNVVKKY